jgi:hypothetical protein
LYAVSAAEHGNRVGVSCGCLAHRYGNAADRPMRERVYPTDLTDAQWAVIAPLIPVPAWLAGRGGYEGIAADVEHDKTQAEFYKRVQAYPYSTTSISTPNTTVAGRVMLERYPEKTVVVSSMAELRQLRALRIRRARPDTGQPG